MSEADPSDRLLIELGGESTLLVARKLRSVPLDSAAPEPLSPLECLVILHIHRQPGISPSSLGRELGVSTSNTATVLRGLERKHLVERRSDPGDGRAARLHSTDAAGRAVAAFHRARLRRLGAAGLDREQIAAAVRTLSHLDRALSDSAS